MQKGLGATQEYQPSVRIIDAGRGKEALIKIRDSKPINKAHPEAEHMASELLSKYFC